LHFLENQCGGYTSTRCQLIGAENNIGGQETSPLTLRCFPYYPNYLFVLLTDDDDDDNDVDE